MCSLFFIGEKMILSLRLTIGSEPEQLPNRKLVQQSVRFRTATGNSGDVFLANSYVSANDAGMRYSLPAGNSQKLELNKLDDLWYSGTLNDTLDLITEIE